MDNDFAPHKFAKKERLLGLMKARVNIIRFVMDLYRFYTGFLCHT